MKIRVKVIPNSSKEELIKTSDGEFVAYLKEKAEKGKANLRLINILAKEFKIDARNVKIKNPKSREKIVELLS